MPAPVLSNFLWSLPKGSEVRGALIQFLKLVLSFAPWLAFLLIARDSLLRVNIGLIVGLALSIALGFARINKGIILWASLAFFACAVTAVTVLHDMWTLRYMGVLANGTLAAVMWLTILIGKPFTLEYAREQAAPALWSSPAFMSTNNVISAVWAASLSLNTALAFGKMRTLLVPDVAYDVVSYATLLGAIVFTIWYPRHVRKKASR